MFRRLLRRCSSISSKTSPSIWSDTLPLDLLPEIIGHCDNSPSTLAALALVSKYANKLATSLLYSVVTLHTPKAQISFFREHLLKPSRRAKLVRHVDFKLQLVFEENKAWRKYLLATRTLHHLELDTLRLETSGPLYSGNPLSRQNLRSLIQPILHRLSGCVIGPKHFQWRHYDPWLPPGHEHDGVFKSSRELYSPKGLFEFSSTWARTVSLDLPRVTTQRPETLFFPLDMDGSSMLEYVCVHRDTYAPSLISEVVHNLMAGREQKRFLSQTETEGGSGRDESRQGQSGNVGTGTTPGFALDLRWPGGRRSDVDVRTWSWVAGLEGRMILGVGERGRWNEDTGGGRGREWREIVVGMPWRAQLMGGR